MKMNSGRRHVFRSSKKNSLSAQEVTAAALYVKDILGQEPVQKLISELAKDEM